MNRTILFYVALTLAISSIGAGIIGMLLAAPYMWYSHSVEIISGASLTFIAGSILFSSGIISFAILSKQ
jgi:hypothetical protein